MPVRHHDDVDLRLVPKEVEALDTGNEWFVTALETSGVPLVILQRQPNHRLTRDEALRLAAWLIVGAEMAGHPHALEVATATVHAVRNT